MAGRPRVSALADKDVEGGPAVTTGAIKPIDLKDYDGPLYVSNNGTTIISVNLSQAKGDAFRIGPKGSLDGQLPLPKEVVTNYGFQRIWRKGIVSVTTDSAMEELLMLADTQLNQQTKLPLEVEFQKSSSESDITPGENGFEDFTITEKQARESKRRSVGVADSIDL